MLVYAFDDPYKVLEVSRSASFPEIKNSYRELARKWHPDRNTDPGAQTKFIEVTKAYELLSDPERRDEFDKFGTTENSPNFKSKFDYSSFKRFDFDPFESLFASTASNGNNNNNLNSGKFNSNQPHTSTDQTSSSSSPSSSSSSNTINGNNGHRFQFSPDQGSLFRKQSITTRSYENRLIVDSYIRPYLVLFYGDLCIPCFDAEPIWSRIITELEPLGVAFATIHSQHESLLARKLGVNSLPYVVGIADGIVKHYKESQLSLTRVIEFIRRLLPRNLITHLDDSTYPTFLNGYSDNRIRVIFANHDSSIRLRYLLLAYKFRDRVASGHICLESDRTAEEGDFAGGSEDTLTTSTISSSSPFTPNSSGRGGKVKSSNTPGANVHTSSTSKYAPSICGRSEEFVDHYALDRKMDSLVLFNEITDHPIATLSSRDLKYTIMNDLIESNKFLLLPRLSSPLLFDQLCPSESLRSRRKLCIILVTNNIPGHNLARDTLRQFIIEHKSTFTRERFRFMYINHEKQSHFIQQLTTDALGSPSSSPVLHIVIIWRREYDRILYEWLDSPWNPSDFLHFNMTRTDLYNLLIGLSKDLETLPNDIRFKSNSLIDEDAHGIFGKVIKKILIMTDDVTESITQKEILPIVTVILSIGFILLIGYIMQYLVKMEEESIQERYRRLGRTPPGVPAPKPQPKLKIHELRGETYNGLVRLLKPGCRTLVLLVDKSSKSKLLPKFYKAVYPYRKNKTLMFAYLLIEKNLDWYRKILQQTLGEQRELNINPKNCIGTVIALNGFRKYFCVYHAKHAESSRATRVSPLGPHLPCQFTNCALVQQAARRKAAETESTAGSASFMGFEESDESDSEATPDLEAGTLIRSRNSNVHSSPIVLTPEEETLSSIVFEEHLLDGLSAWLDRLFDGTTHKYHIQYWPEHMK